MTTTQAAQCVEEAGESGGAEGDGLVTRIGALRKEVQIGPILNDRHMESSSILFASFVFVGS